MLRNYKLSINSSELSPADDDQVRNWIISEGGVIADDADIVLTLEQVKNKISVLPHWVDDTVKLNRQIPLDCYTYPDPPLITGDYSKCSKAVVSRDEPVDLKSRTFHFTDKNIERELGTDLSSLGAIVSDTYHDDVTDVVVDYRKGSVYIKAERENKAVGSTLWIQKILQDKCWSDPKVNLIYYPIPTYPVPGMENAIVTVSGYTGQTRRNIAKMVVAVGATFTRYLTESHTHLICAFDNGEKYEKAAGWNIHIVNLTWIEEVFQKWEHQREASPRFVTFNTGYLDMNTRIQDLDQWLVEGSSECEQQEHMSSIRTDVNRYPVLSEKRMNSLSEPKQDSKRFKMDPNQGHVITFTGCRPTLDEENFFRSQDVQLVKSVHNSTIVVADKVARTEKFLVALSLGLPIVSKSWITESYLSNSILDSNDFPLVDHEAEAKYEFTLKESMALARSRKLLAGVFITSTPKVIPGPTTLKMIIDAAGGTYVEKPTRKEFMEFAKKAEKDHLHYLVLSTVEDRSSFSKLIPASLNMYTSEILLTGVLRQSLPLNNPIMFV